MNKKEATKLFLDRTESTLRGVGYSRKGMRFIKRFADQGISVVLDPQFIPDMGLLDFDVFVEIHLNLYTEAYTSFRKSVFPEYKIESASILTLSIKDIIGNKIANIENVEFFIQEFLTDMPRIEESIEKNFSSKNSLLSYFSGNHGKGGVNRSLIMFVLLEDVKGRTSACEWLHSGEPHKASVYQVRQLEYLINQCAN